MPSLHIILSKKRMTKTLIRLRGCAGWSAPVLFAKPRRQVFSRRGPYDSFYKNIKVYQARYSVLLVLLISVFYSFSSLQSITGNACSKSQSSCIHISIRMLLSWQVDDDGSLNGLVVHMWNVFIRSEITSITSENSLTP